MDGIVENIDWLITLFTFIGGIYMYVNHTRRLNNQQHYCPKKLPHRFS